jgi:predicted membrane chloride channel (bestrophin family)
LARNVDVDWKTIDDPMLHVQALRLHLYTINEQLFQGEDDPTMRRLEMLERMRMLDQLDEFTVHYRNLLKCASTPLPFTMVQMGRTFLFLWTFTIPLVLRGVVNEIYSAMVFVFFLTYGFVGLELVGMKLMNPFGDGSQDLNVTGMKQATALGIERDLHAFGEEPHLNDKRLEYSRQKVNAPMKSPLFDSGGTSLHSNNLPHDSATNLLLASSENLYHPMH